jgi:hypothetical protein
VLRTCLPLTKALDVIKAGASRSWREDGDAAAFDHESWEFRARQFESSSKFLLSSFDDRIKAADFQVIMLLPTAEFLLSLAIELICKAFLLKAKIGEPEAIYRHDVSELLPKGLLSEEQRMLMLHAERYVVWAGRYPTPKWKKEVFKEEFDVPSVVSDGIERIDAGHVPNSSSRPRCDEMLALYEHLRQSWANA